MQVLSNVNLMKWPITWTMAYEPWWNNCVRLWWGTSDTRARDTQGRRRGKHFFFSPGSRWQPHLDHSCNHQGPSQERMPRSVQVSHPGRKCTFALFHRSYAEMNEEDTLYCSAHFQPSFPDIYFSLGLLSLCHTPLPHEWVAIKQYLFCFIATCIM